MKAFRYRIVDILILTTIVSLALGAHLVGFRMRIPRFLKGDFDSYLRSEVVEAGAEPWHKPPTALSHPEGSGEEHAIVRIDDLTAPRLPGVKRVNWVPLIYDILLTTWAVLLVLNLGRRIRGGRRDALSFDTRRSEEV